MTKPPTNLCRDCRDHWAEAVGRNLDGNATPEQAAELATKEIWCNHGSGTAGRLTIEDLEEAKRFSEKGKKVC